MEARFSEEEFFLALLFNASQCATVFCTLRIFRALGCRLLQEPRQPSVPAPVQSDTDDLSSPPAQA